MTSSKKPRRRVRRVELRFRDTYVSEDIPKYNTRITTACAAASLANTIIGSEVVEVMLVLLLDSKHRLMGVHETGRGNENNTPVSPSSIFRAAIIAGASSIVMAHNHPSGVVEPSNQDYICTRRMQEAAYLLGINLLDHIIVGGKKKFFSFSEKENWEDDEHTRTLLWERSFIDLALRRGTELALQQAPAPSTTSGRRRQTSKISKLCL